LSLKFLHGLLSLLFLILLSAKLPAQDIVLQLDTLPTANQLRPFSEPADIAISLTNPDRTPIENGWVQVRLDAPDPGRFFSTDFLFVEGTRLLEMRLPIRHGKVEWQYLFPIRGSYRIAAEAVTIDGRKAEKSFAIKVKEKERKWLFLGLFTLGLFSLGFVAGRIFTPLQMDSKQNAALWMFLLFFGLVSYNEKAFTQELKTERYAGRFEITAATVGKLSQIRWYLVGAGAEKGSTNLTLKITHLEKRKTVFAVEKVPVTREFSMNFQFTDGADYRVEAVAYVENSGLIRSERTVSVIGPEPPASTAIPALGFFLTVIGLGLWAGRWSRRATSNGQRHAMRNKA
jgi:hypothetical protein